MKQYLIITYFLIFAEWTSSCKTTTLTVPADPVVLPFLKNTANECYYLDEFMPTADSMVSGRSGAVNLRYYSYKTANYKLIKASEISLAFYSHDGRCWSLFEEYTSHTME